MPRLAAVFASLLLTVAMAATPVRAQDAAAIGPMFEALGLGELLEIMREEGLGYGADLREELFPTRGAEEWPEVVSEIYRVDRMAEAIREGLAAELTPDEIAAITAFFADEDGARIVELELAARRALLDPAVEESATETWTALEADGDPRWAQLQEFAQVNDLVERNVAGAMTSNYAFYMGLIDGKAFDFTMTEQEILADVWSQEQSIREETADWVYSFGALAYLPLSEEAFAEYIAFTATPEGQALNAALFTSFNDLFTAISRDLGLGAARFLAGQDI